MPSKVCLALLSGIPAAGKTTLADLFREFVDSVPFDLRLLDDREKKGRLRVIHLPYDKLIPEDIELVLAALTTAEESNISLWKQYRRRVRRCVDRVLQSFLTDGVSLSAAVNRIREKEDPDLAEQESLICEQFCDIVSQQLIDHDSPSEEPLATIFIVDDNFFYRSMRYEYFQLARKHSVGFCQVHVACPVSIAVARNGRRTTPISKGTYDNMAAKIEEPGTSRASWETNYLIVDGGSQMWGLMNDALRTPIQPLDEEDLEGKEQSRAASLTSILHQADLILRKCVSDSISRAKAGTKVGASAADIKSFAGEANLARTRILDGIREERLLLPPLDDGGGLASPCNDTSAPPSETFGNELERMFREVLLPRDT